jgi:hypothetical protein
MRNILEYSNIPLENIILRILYEYTLVYKRFGSIPCVDQDIRFTHDETRGCLFDMTGHKRDVVHSCTKPKLCNACTHKLQNEGISKEIIEAASHEIKKIQKRLFYRIYDFIKIKPVVSILISSVYALVIGVFGNYIYDYLKKTMF